MKRLALVFALLSLASASAQAFESMSEGFRGRVECENWHSAMPYISVRGSFDVAPDTVNGNNVRAQLRVSASAAGGYFSGPFQGQYQEVGRQAFMTLVPNGSGIREIFIDFGDQFSGNSYVETQNGRWYKMACRVTRSRRR